MYKSSSTGLYLARYLNILRIHNVCVCQTIRLGQIPSLKSGVQEVKVKY